MKAALKAGLDDKAVYAVQLAVDEACSNIIDHAYGGEGVGELECSVAIQDDGLKVILRDQGRPFDPKKIPPPKIEIPLEELKPRGVGYFLMTKMMDRIDYRYSNKEGNVLTMFKRRKG